MSSSSAKGLNNTQEEKTLSHERYWTINDGKYGSASIAA